MKPLHSILFPPAALGLICLSLIFLCAPAGAAIVVVGSSLATDCYLIAKTNGDPLHGIETCNLALQEEPLNKHDRAGTLVNRGVMKVTLGRFDEALQDYNAGITLAPDLGDAYVDRGGAYIHLKRYDDALADIDAGLKMEMSAPHVAYYNRAVAYHLMGRYGEAYRDYKHALELRPDFTQASERLKDFVVTRKPAG